MKPPVDAPMSSAMRARHVDAEHVERMSELEAAAADVGMIRRGQHDLRVVGHAGAGFGRHLRRSRGRRRRGSARGPARATRRDRARRAATSSLVLFNSCRPMTHRASAGSCPAIPAPRRASERATDALLPPWPA